MNKTSRAQLYPGKMGLSAGRRGRHASAFWSMRCRGKWAGRRFSSWVGREWRRKTSASVTSCFLLWMQPCQDAMSWYHSSHGVAMRAKTRRIRDANPMSYHLWAPRHPWDYLQISRARDLDPCLCKVLLAMLSVTCNQKIIFKSIYFLLGSCENQGEYIFNTSGTEWIRNGNCYHHYHHRHHRPQGIFMGWPDYRQKRRNVEGFCLFPSLIHPAFYKNLYMARGCPNERKDEKAKSNRKKWKEEITWAE